MVMDDKETFAVLPVQIVVQGVPAAVRQEGASEFFKDILEKEQDIAAFSGDRIGFAVVGIKFKFIY